MKTEFSYQQLSRKRIFIIWMAVILCIAAFAGNVLVRLIRNCTCDYFERNLFSRSG